MDKDFLLGLGLASGQESSHKGLNLYNLEQVKLANEVRLSFVSDSKFVVML